MRNNMTFTPSKYQDAVFDFIKDNGKRHAAIQAVAGSGKTTTIVEALKFIPSSNKVLFLAFNKSIAEELAKRVPSNVQAMTLNSFGWRVCMKAFGRIKLDTWKVGNILKGLMNPVTPKEVKEFYKFKFPICKLIGLLKANLVLDESEALTTYEELAEKHEIEIPTRAQDDFVSLLLGTFGQSIQVKHTMDFDDQLYMPLAHNLAIPIYDWVFIDESQDLNLTQIELVLRIGRKIGRVICVGDKNQAIYGFRGADPGAMNNLISSLEATELPLSICYRCAKSIVREAKTIVPEIEWCDSQSEGTVSRVNDTDFRNQVIGSDFVLCRTTAPLVSSCLKFLKEGRKATIKGRDIGNNLCQLVDKISGDRDSMSSKEFYELAVSYCNAECEKLARTSKEDSIAVIKDKLEVLGVIVEESKTVSDIKKRIEAIFSDTIDGIMHSTIHRAKGLESKNVYILKPELLPHPSAKQAWQVQQENNLKYVAITRAMENLYYVSN